MKIQRKINYAPIHPDLDLDLDAPSSKAGGLGAVWSSQKFVWKSIGVKRGLGLLATMNQKGGFDCPGCAWPEPEGKRPIAEFCENGVKALAEEACSTLLSPEDFKKNSVEELSQLSDFQLGQLGRIQQPMVLRPDSLHYESLSWDAAFAEIGQHLRQTEADRSVFYTSGRTSNEAAFLYQLMAKCKGTNNLPDCSNLCHESSGTALNQSIGIGKGTVKLEDFYRSDLILIFGQNPGTNHPRMLSALRVAVKNGAKIVSINPLFEAGLKKFSHPQKLADVLGGGVSLAYKHLGIRINGDQALLMGLGKILTEAKPDGLDPEFCQKSCESMKEWIDSLAEISWDLILAETGLQKDDILSLAQDILNAKSMISCWAMGLTQQPQAVATIRQLANLHLWGGFIGKPGSGLCPVRGHSNVQGNRTVGIYEKPSKEFQKSLERVYGSQFPSEPGYDVVDTIKAMNRGAVDFFMSLGGNFLSASPDTEFTGRALEKLAVSVHVATKLNRSHLATGHSSYLLPCLARSEHHPSYQTVENSMGYVHFSRGRGPHRSKFWRSEIEIICSIAHSALPDSLVPWLSLGADYDLIREHIQQCIAGFEGYNEKTKDGAGFYLPNPPRDERKFSTLSGKAAFYAGSLEALSIPEGQFILMTIRSHDQYNTTIYGLDDRYRGVYQGRRLLFMNGNDMKAHQLIKNQEVDIISHFQGKKRIAKRFRVIPYEIPPSCLAAYFPEANVLVPVDSVAKESQTPTSKFIAVSLKPVDF